MDPTQDTTRTPYCHPLSPPVVSTRGRCRRGGGILQQCARSPFLRPRTTVGKSSETRNRQQNCFSPFYRYGVLVVATALSLGYFFGRLLQRRTLPYLFLQIQHRVYMSIELQQYCCVNSARTCENASKTFLAQHQKQVVQTMENEVDNGGSMNISSRKAGQLDCNGSIS